MGGVRRRQWAADACIPDGSSALSLAEYQSIFLTDWISGKSNQAAQAVSGQTLGLGPLLVQRSTEPGLAHCVKTFDSQLMNAEAAFLS